MERAHSKLPLEYTLMFVSMIILFSSLALKAIMLRSILKTRNFATRSSISAYATMQFIVIESAISNATTDPDTGLYLVRLASIDIYYFASNNQC